LRLEGARLLLVTGTAGSGKRIVGNLLVDEHRYVHIDLDNPHANRRFLGHGLEGLRAELDVNLEPGQDTVVTWTPSPNEALPFVRLMLAYGFDWVWLDGDRGAAFHGYFSANGDETARFVDPFEVDGRFRPVAPVLAEVLEPGPAVQRLPVRKREPRRVPAFGRASVGGGRARAGLAGAAAFAAAGVAACAYLLLGGIGGKGVPAAQATPAKLPVTGILVSGESLGGVRLGFTKQDVRKLWGHGFTVCSGCEPETWFYW
jgi:hypothetical protein